MRNAIAVCLAAVLLAPTVRVREPSWPMAAAPTDIRGPVRVQGAAGREAPPRVLERAVPEDRPVTPRPRVVVAPAPGWPSASVDPGPRM